MQGSYNRNSPLLVFTSFFDSNCSILSSNDALSLFSSSNSSTAMIRCLFKYNISKLHSIRKLIFEEDTRGTQLFTASQELKSRTLLCFCEKLPNVIMLLFLFIIHRLRKILQEKGKKILWLPGRFYIHQLITVTNAHLVNIHVILSFQPEFHNLTSLNKKQKYM